MQHSLKILVIEDDLPIRLMYEMKLKIAGYSVSVAKDGLEGLDKFHEFKPKIILLDIKLPHMNGDEVLRRIRLEEHGQSVKVVILTNISRDEAPRILGLLNVSRYIVKAHHTPAQILDVVNELAIMEA